MKKKETEEEKREREALEKENEITIEDFLEKERHNLGPNLTPVTAESFAEWKKNRKERDAALESEVQKKKSDEYKRYKAGMKTGMTFSGKELFDFNPEWANALEEDDAMDNYQITDSKENDLIDDAAAPNLEIFKADELEGLD